MRLLTPTEVETYSRHIIMPEIGSIGQRRLLDARVLVVGIGGLGAPAIWYLARAGVGTVGIADFDTVELSNLHRQPIYKYSDVGRHKVDAARDSILQYNPNIKVEPHKLQLNSSNAMNLIEQYDVVLNGADNFPTRYLLNDTAFLAKKPLADGAVLAFEGQVSTYIAGQGCYRCLFPTPPPLEDAPNCSEAGVLGVMPSIIGSLQALEVIKIVTKVGTSMAGRLLLLDGLLMEFKTIKVERNADCVLCGDSPQVTKLMDYEQFCGSN